MKFHPVLCRNETEVESKLITQYLLPQLGYTPDTWSQEVAFGKARLDFLAFATSFFPRPLDAVSQLSVVIEAKHPREKLDDHVRKFKQYLNKLHICHGLLTNGKEIRIYERIQSEIYLKLTCRGEQVEDFLPEIKQLIGRDELQNRESNGRESNGRESNETLNPAPPVKPITPSPPPWSPQSTPDATPDSENISANTNNQDTPPIIHKFVATHRDIANFNPVQRANQVKKTMKVITVYHNKGGVGKTTTVVNLAAALTKKGKRVLIIDLDSQANTTFATGLIKFEDEQEDDIKESNILQLLQSEEFDYIPDIARKSQFTDPEVDVVPSHIDLMQYETDLNSLDYSRLILRDKLNQVSDTYDVVLIDTPPSLNFYARIALIATDYLIIPSDLKPFANQGLTNVKDFVKTINGFRRQIGRSEIDVLGVLACQISTNARFVQHTLRKRLQTIPERYALPVLDTVIYEREDLAKCTEEVQEVDGHEIPNPRSILDYKPNSKAAQEFELLGMEVLDKVGVKV
ncbi:AAA family ATPase [Spirulina sp. CS-785/01]|uniref:AAA family ATPase n=1 Tax=Spirulina sp. CS-785/01 TaxID=3021716 RepID=UPI00232C5C8B|nr:AAA family ATPase [Spirulina sp. CS-785/01]MDB9313202.1 AAA family ATPase [Spirulina sp. CS-785/01]